MSREISVRSSLSVRNGSLQYQSNPTAFAADQSVVGGPTPGQIVAATAGTNVDLSALASPGLCRVMNLDAVNSCDVGVYDASADKFYPLVEVRPSESFVFRLSTRLNDEYPGGTGTGSDAPADAVQVRGKGGAVKILFEAFED